MKTPPKTTTKVIYKPSIQNYDRFSLEICIFLRAAQYLENESDARASRDCMR